MAIQMLDTDRNEINAPVGRMEWLRADTIHAWAHQRDLNKAAVNKIARDFDPDTLGTLTITRRGGVNYLLDGQHRLAAIKDVLGWADQNVPCIVYEGLTDAQEAKLFNAQAPGKRRQLSPLHAMYVAYQAGDERVSLIVATVERSGLQMAWTGNSKSNNMIAAATAVQQTADKYGPYRLQTVLEILRDGLGPHARAYAAVLIKGMMAFHLRYADRYNRAELVTRLQGVGCVALLRQAGAISGALGGNHTGGVGQAILQAYNKGRSLRRLEDWAADFRDPATMAASQAKAAQTLRSDFARGIRKPSGAIGARIAAADAAD